jgi:tetratricopeptide (TPR) repeat protein
LQDLDRAVSLQPSSGALWNERCWIRGTVGELQGALSDCNEAIRLEPKLATRFNTRGFTYLKSEQWDLAIADFNGALQIDTKLASALYGRGYAKMKKGDVAGGKSDIAAAQVIKKDIEAEYAGYGIH